MKLLRLVLLAVFTLASTLHLSAHARLPVPIINHENVPISTLGAGQYKAEQIRDAFIRAGAQRGWVIVPKGPALVATHNVRSHQAVALITYDTQKFSIVYQTSTNLKYEPAGGGAGLIHPFYNTWVSNLIADTRALLLTVPTN